MSLERRSIETQQSFRDVRQLDGLLESQKSRLHAYEGRSADIRAELQNVLVELRGNHTATVQERNQLCGEISNLEHQEVQRYRLEGSKVAWQQEVSSEHAIYSQANPTLLLSTSKNVKTNLQKFKKT